MGMLKYAKFIFKTNMFIAVLLSLCLTPAAEIYTALASETVGFSVAAVQSLRQLNKDVSYFDLRLSPGEEHVLEVDIFNNGESPINTSVTACAAGTNPSGVIEYDNINVTDDSLIVSFADVATVEAPTIRVPAAGTTRAKITVKMPDTSFDGVMLGGIVIKKDMEADEEPAAGGTIIQNEFCYVIAVKISTNETVVEPDFKLRSVGPTLSNYRTNIAANLQNFHAAIAKGVEIDANVYYNNGPDPIFTNSSKDFNVAPNSNFNYLIPCEGKLAAGDYRLLMTAAYGNRIWEFDETFSITDTVANGINGQAVNVPGINYYMLATVCLSLVLVILIVVILWRRTAGRRE